MLATAAALATIDTVYVARRRISPIYLLDAAAEIAPAAGISRAIGVEREEASMPSNVDDTTLDTDRLRHDLNSGLTIIHARAELLRRQILRRDGFSDEDRRWLAEGLAAILVAARMLEARIDRLPRRGGHREDG